MYSANTEMGSTDESYSHTGYEPKNYDLVETCVESLTESMTEQRFSEQRFLEDVDYDDAALEEMLDNAHREHVYHSQREGLSVGQSSSSVSERTEQPVVETVAKSHDRTGVLRTVRQHRLVRHATHPMLPSGPSTQLEFFHSHALPAVCWLGCHRPPPGVGHLSLSVGCCYSYRAGTVDHRGFYP